ncbi:MAG TPA: DUF4388 domain-containing protein [Thermoanaerobaculia bacterium]|nr:DUF4388 domain-containing protein [Thermoanaerobaculia bacterium]
MALEGTLRDFSLADIYQLIGLQRKTGVLTLKGKDDTVTVTFLDGKVVAADSLKRKLENRLGAVLVRTGYLSQDQLNRALEIQKETLQRLGFILTHHGIISQDELREALQLQILQIIYRLFRWKDGEYHFSQETVIEYDHDHLTPITAESILMEGARMIDEWPIIEKRIRSYDLVFVKKAVGQEIVVVGEDDVDEVDFEPTSPGKKKKGGDQIRISAQEKMVFDLVNGKSTVAEIIESSRASEFDTAKALYELVSRDLIEEVRATRRSATPVPVDQTAPSEVPNVLPLPLVIVIALVVVASLVTGVRNPVNIFTTTTGPSPIDGAKKSISLQRIETIGDAIEAFTLATGRLPSDLADLSPHFLSAIYVRDPWGHEYKYIQRPEKYLVIGFLPDGKPDTDLFLTYAIRPEPTTETRPPSGGIVLVD